MSQCLMRKVLMGILLSPTLVFLLFFGIADVEAAMYNGSLLYQDWGAINTGLEVVSGNIDGWGVYTGIEWFVSNEQPDKPSSYPWFYQYTVTVQKYGLSHLTLELSDDFGLIDITQIEVNGLPHSVFEIKTHEPGPGSPDMPGSLYGIKVDDLGGGFDENDQNVTHIISFFSNRMPVWGDAYLKCGGFGNQAWNQGFGGIKPSDPPSSGSVDAHLLVPNAIPEPMTMGFFLFGAWGLFLRRRIL